jgi:O-antigen/teichoic acid export membrane protein
VNIKLEHKLDALKERYKNAPIQIRAAIWLTICSFLQRGISVITTPIFTRLLTTAEYGEFNVFQSWSGILCVIVTLYLPWGVFEQGLVKFEKKRDEFVSSLQILLLSMVILWGIIYALFRDFFNGIFSMETNEMIPMIIMMWTSSVFCFWSATKRVDYDYKSIVILTIIVSVMKPLTGIIMVLNSTNKVLARIWGLCIVEFISYSGLFVSQVRKSKNKISAKICKYALKFNIKLVPHYLSQTLLNGADRIMIERMVAVDAAGIYSLAYSVSQIMSVFNSALLQTISPWNYRKIKKKEFGEICKITYPAMIFVAVINLAVILVAPEIVCIFAPEEYMEAIWVIPPITMSVFFVFMYGLFSFVEFYYEKTAYMSVATVIGATLNVLLNYFAIGWFGYYAAGYTTLICYMIYAVCHYINMKNCLKKENIKGLYAPWKLILGSLMFLTIGFSFMLTYLCTVIRYILITLLILSAFLCRKEIGAKLKMFLKNDI